MKKMIRVLIVDDSALMREMFTNILNEDPDIEVIGVAIDPFDAREKIKQLNPDVLTLDIEMPKMDGISFLEKIMKLRPMPVVMVSSLTQKGAEATIKALEIGAIDYVPKTGSASFDIESMGDELISKVKAASRAKVGVAKQISTQKATAISANVTYKNNMLIAIGSSTGGVESLREIISAIPANTPPIMIVQHMPATFTKTFAQRLDSFSQATVHEATDGMVIESGNVYLAPGDKHIEVKIFSGKRICKLHDGVAVSGHKPSVDVLFDSVGKTIGKNAVGVILTGMGKDGAIGMLKMKEAGAYNIGQNETTCVVYGMPKAAYLAGAVDKQHPLNNIAKEMLNKCI